MRLRRVNYAPSGRAHQLGWQGRVCALAGGGGLCAVWLAGWARNAEGGEVAEIIGEFGEGEALEQMVPNWQFLDSRWQIMS